jgi:hypothetical protein
VAGICHADWEVEDFFLIDFVLVIDAGYGQEAQGTNQPPGE